MHSNPGVPDSPPRALFAVSSLGLGHATRTLVVIREYLRRGYAITVVSAGNALAFLRLELQDETAVQLREMPDYPPLERGSGWRLYAYLALDLLKTWHLIRQERRIVRALAANYDLIFSDGRYGFHSQSTPSFILTHQIAFLPPRGLREASWLTGHINVAALRRFDCVFIPDYPYPNANLAGNLAHSHNLHRCRHAFVGILSSYPQRRAVADIDYLFVISGYLLEHKDAFIRSLLSEAAELPGRKVFILGNAAAEAAEYAQLQREDLTIHAMASGEQRLELFSRARCVITRAGYTTIMDLIEHGKRAVLIPTPNQTEQEYLAYHLASRGYFVSRTQRAPDLRLALHECARTAPFEPPWRTADSLQRLCEGIEPFVHKNFISVIVPAHNEEKELAATLRALLAQRYPARRMEIIVVENGSDDATTQIALGVAAEPAAAGRIRVLRSERGVSFAKNTGLRALSSESQWTVFCDADTRLGPHFLHQLNTWLNRRSEAGLGVGTTAVRPHPGAPLYARAWFALYDLIHRLTRSSYSIQIARTSIARGVGFHETLNFAEDLTFIHECRRYGRFFFLPTDQVSTSTRRFAARGYLRQGLRWLFEALLPLRCKIHRAYDVLR